MSVTVTAAQGAAYLWSNAGFAWDSAEGGKAWNEAAATSFLAADTEIVGLSPREARIPTASRFEGLSLVDARRTIAIASLARALSLADARVMAATARRTDGLALGDAARKLSTVAKSNTFALGDARKTTAVSSRTNVLHLAETYIDLIAFTLKVVESFALQEVAPRQVVPAPRIETFGIADTAARLAQKIAAQTLALSDTRLSTGAHLSRESGAFAEAAYRGVVQPRTRAFAVSEAGARIPNKASAEPLALSAARRTFAQHVSNGAAALAEAIHKTVLAPRIRTLALAESRTATAKPDARQALSLSDTYIDLIDFVVQVVEQMSMADRKASSPTHRSAETIALLDRLLRASDAVIADLAFWATPLDAQGFAALVNESRPLGFAAFKELTPGDYEYASALVRLVLEAPVTTANRIALADAQLNIDVPDVRDRGAIAVPVGGTIVAFNRVFNAPPEVQASFKGGASLAIPQIGTIGTSGFQLTLVNPDTQTSVAGTASWSAEGY